MPPATVITSIDFAAVNLYQTSSSGFSPFGKPQDGIPDEAVAAYVFVPIVYDGEIGSVMLFEQLSLIGGEGTPLTQIENSPLPGAP